MGCFSACFGSSSTSTPAKRINPHQPFPPPAESGNKVSLNISKAEEVTFDSNVKPNEHVLLPHKEPDSVFGKKEDRNGEEQNLQKASKIESSSEDFAISPSLGSYPPTHRYSNCRDSDDEDGVFEDYFATDENDCVEYNNLLTDDEFGIVESERKVSAVTLFTEEVHSSTPVYGLPKNELNPSGLKQNSRSSISPVLNPVENLSQWNAVKLKETLPATTPQKENLKLEHDSSTTLYSPESTLQNVSFSFKSKADRLKKLDQKVAVDASLSNWLVSSETTPVSKTCRMALDTFTPVKCISQGSNSLRSHEVKLNLGALTVEEFKQFPFSNSPRKSPSRSPDEKPIIGTVGTYWSQTITDSDKDHDSASSLNGIPNTTSKYTEDKTVKWHSTPFETRLERALNRGISKA